MMKQSLNENIKIAWWSDPVLLGFGAIYAIALLTSFVISTDWLPNILLGLGIIVSSVLVLAVSRKYAPQPLDIKNPSGEFWTVISWFGAFMLLSILWKGGGIFADDFAKWLWFVILPIGLLLIVRSPKIDFIGLLRSIGLRRRGSKKAILLGLLAFIVVLPLIVFSLSAEHQQKLANLVQKPLNLLLALPVSFGLALITAGITEEVFFRGILQARLAKVLDSELQSCVIIAFLFGIYHLPYAYFSPAWPTHGNFVWALSAVLTEQMLTGLLLGILWMRTHHLLDPIILHSLINMLAMLTMIKFG